MKRNDLALGRFLHAILFTCALCPSQGRQNTLKTVKSNAASTALIVRCVPSSA